MSSLPTTTSVRVSATVYGANITGLSNLAGWGATATVYANIVTTATSVDAANKVYLTSIANLVVGMPIVFASSFGNIVAGTTYYISGLSSSIQISASATLSPTFTTGVNTPTNPVGVTAHTTTTRVSATNNATPGTLTIGSSNGLVVDMPIVFQSSFGGVTGGTVYYLSNIGGGGHTIQVATTRGGTGITTTTSSGLTVKAYVWTVSSPPAYYRIQQPCILAGMTASLSTDAAANGGSDHMTVSVYRTPIGSDLQRGISAIPFYTMIFNSGGSDQTYYDTSQTFSVGDRIHVFVWFTPTTTAHDLSVQLDLF